MQLTHSSSVPPMRGSANAAGVRSAKAGSIRRAFISGALGLLVACAGLVVPGPTMAAPILPHPQLDWSVVPVFFVPTDWSTGDPEVQDEAQKLRTALQEIREFYGHQLNRATFRLENLAVIQANGPKEQYGIRWNGGNIYEDGVEIVGNLEDAVVRELDSRGFPTPPGQNRDGYSTLIFVKGAGGWAGAREFHTGDGGWGILGDWAIDSIQGQVPEGAYWWSGRRSQVGAAAHELGHTFGLPHPDAWGLPVESSIMGNWWDYPSPGLNVFDRNHLVTAKANFFPTSPEVLLAGVNGQPATLK